MYSVKFAFLNFKKFHPKIKWKLKNDGYNTLVLGIYFLSGLKIVREQQMFKNKKKSFSFLTMPNFNPKRKRVQITNKIYAHH